MSTSKGKYEFFSNLFNTTVLSKNIAINCQINFYTIFLLQLSLKPLRTTVEKILSL